MVMTIEKGSIDESFQFGSLQRSHAKSGRKRGCFLCYLASLCSRMMEALSFADEDRLSFKTSHVLFTVFV